MHESMRIGVVGIPGKWSTEVLADRLQAATGYRRIIDIREVCADVKNGRLLHQGFDLCQLDALVVKKITEQYSPSSLDRLELLRLAEQSGLAVFSAVDSIYGLVNRLTCTLKLSAAGIPMPDTRICSDIGSALSAVQAFGSAVFKPLFSTKARGMCVLQAEQADLPQQIQAYQAAGNPVMYIQQKLELPGRDLGLVFVGGEYLCSYARVSAGQAWNTTIHSGGHYAACQPDDAIIDLARRAQAAFKLDFTTVDVAESTAGPVVFEVSAFGGFRGALEACQIDAAAHYTQHILRVLSCR